MIAITQEDIAGLKKAGRVMAQIREAMKAATKPGITTKELDEIGGRLFEENGAVSGPKSEYDFPGYTCISVNEQVAHGIPGNLTLKEGDLINIDVSGHVNGYFADTGVSFVVGEGSYPEIDKLCQVAESAFDRAMTKVKPGARLNQIGKAVEREAKANGLAVIMNLTGHGIGRSLHEDPQHVLNYFDAWDRTILKEGMVLAVEPFISQKAEHIVEAGDGWTFITPDKSLVAQYEHTIIVTDGEPIITTKLD
ncbi:type I methionyl aminopeptidase [Viridibacillus sp. FSL R5-0477]|uniref:Methionine aminopeptidase n=1 Tax=Viridibacillus arenosi FSL R5-213 TaxID=1227360 RepID=W4F939_9BACL|nr:MULTISPECIES: type I methionyl aminopeptidase [Viridibacillus]ETT88774.1 methionine aminopeptidase [Viridibacillus arenosi FSL R5-213]OMC79128.1 type I methionyl aminopeptidase [Viridibacillus sp. FSL H8-0123]OMC83787.1 type I methionyl aminopeptidase [Viridibacillus sp. FSL H7-0596]OMC88307.1 type I methionyl aminopeptidase [Viridibacillus arenosi]